MPHPEPSPAGTGWRRWFAVPTRGRWRRRFAVPTGDLVFAVVGLPLAVACGLYVAGVLYVGGILALTLIGLPLLPLGLQLTRPLAAVHRRLVARLLDEPVAEPPPLGAPRELVAWVGAGLTDPVAWRNVLYLLVRLPLAVITFVGGPFAWLYGAFLVTLPVLSPLAMGNEISWWMVGLGALAGGALLAVAPWTTRTTADVNRWLARSLLAPAPASPRLARLERARSEVADDAATTLRRIERDLHDGTQARLVAVALSLGLADEALTAGGGQRAHDLVRRARSQLGDATAELRQLTRGINPVALDGGLPEALPTLAADAGIPTDVHVDLPRRPSPAIERVVYFCVAELITNAAKHSGAGSVRVDVTAPGDILHLQVTDDGRGGARIGAGSGLRGLRDRLGAVDGTLAVTSPAGGPTVVAAELPVRL